LREASALKDEAFEEAVADLEDAWLLAREEDRRLSLHELVRVYAQGQTSAEQRASLARGLAGALARRLEAAEAERDWGAVGRELVHARAAAGHCREAGLLEALCPLLRGMGCVHFARRDVRPAVECFAEGLEIAERLFGRSHSETARLLR